MVIQCNPNASDILSSWLDSIGGAQLFDSCDVNSSFESFTWTDISGNSGAGNFTGIPTIPIPPGECSWSVSVDFLATDECGNEVITNSTFFIIDTIPPQFEVLPNDTFYNCDDVPSAFNLIAIDECDGFIVTSSRDSSTQSPEQNSCEFFNYTLFRIYEATDNCGNSTSFTQVIQVSDTLEPRFIAPRDTILIGVDSADPVITGSPINVVDNCNSEVEITFTDNVQNSFCQVEILRQWEIRDVCGLSLILPQRITLMDDQAPVIVREADNINLGCDSSILAANLFLNWVANLGNAQAEDDLGFISQQFAAVPGSYDILDPSTFPGTNPGALDQSDCPSGMSGALRFETVDFVFVDECGNAVKSTGTFRISDTEAPQIINPLEDIVLMNDNSSSCEATLTVFPIEATDNCSGDAEPTATSVRVQLTAPNTEDPVDAFTVRLGPFNTSFLPTEEQIGLVIEKTNIDANNDTEYFVVSGENNTPIGITNLTESQCADITTTLFISRALFSTWISDDGFLDITLTPNTVSGIPGLSINDVCGNSFVRVSISLAPVQTFSLNSYLQINDNDPFLINEPLSINLSQGSNELTYIVEDCAGNQDSYVRIVEVEDDIAPFFTCPLPMSLNLPAGECEMLVNLPYDLGIQEVCPEGEISEFNLLSGESSLLTFELLGEEFVAQSKNINFPITQNGALLTDPVLKLFVFGDVNETGETFTIFGENGLAIGSTTPVTDGSCQTQRFDLPINREVYLSWIQDGILSLQVSPNNAQGNYINPCIGGVVQRDGQTDGISAIGIRMSLQKAPWEISISGATDLDPTQINTDQFPLEVMLNAGINNISYTISDLSGNSTSCEFEIRINDVTPPVITCVEEIQAVINPSGTIPFIVDDELLEINAEDDCQLNGVEFNIQELSCNDIGSLQQVIITATDISGNTSVCTSDVVVQQFEIQPIAQQALCFGDSIQLLANVPAGMSPSDYTFSWSGPNDFSSTLENPVILNADGSASGTYTLTVNGQNSCISTGIVDVFVQDFTSPNIVSEVTSLCFGDSLRLSTQQFQSSVVYNWFEGIPGEGQLIATTTDPFISLLPDAGEHNYYLNVESEDCPMEFEPSALTNVEVSLQPFILSISPELDICAGESFQLTADIDDTTGVQFQWNGPDGFSSNELIPPLIQNAQSAQGGLYTLVAQRNQCFSDTIELAVSIDDDLPIPIINPVSPVCEGDLLTLRITNYSSNELSYQWYLDSVPFRNTDAQFLLLSEASAAEEGIWSVVVSNERCKSEMSEPISVDVQLALGLNVTDNGPVCELDSVILFTDTIQNATYQWTGPDGFTSSAINPSNNAIPGLYSVTITSMEGCESSGSTEVSVVNQPNILSLEVDASLCADGMSTALLIAEVSDSNLTYSWSGPNNFSSISESAEIMNYSSRDNGAYVLTVSAGTCVSSPDTISLNVTDAPMQPIIPSEISLCSGDSLIISIIEPRSSDNYIWRTPEGQLEQNQPDIKIQSAESLDGGLYSVTAFTNGCPSIESEPAQVTVFSLPNPPSIFPPSNTCFGGDLEIEIVLEPDTEYEWIGPGGFSSTEPNVLIENVDLNNQGIYRVRKIQNGCTSDYVSTEEITFLEIPPAPAIASSDLDICSSSSSGIELCIDRESFSNGSTFTWVNTTNGQVLANTQNICLDLQTFINLTDGANVIVAQRNISGCVSDESSPIIVNLFSAPSIEPRAQEDATVCSVNNIPIEADPPPLGFGRWSSPDPQISFGDASENNTVVFGLREGANSIFWSLSNGPCLDYSSEEVVLTVQTEAEASDDSFQLTYGEEGLLDVTFNDVLPSEFEVTIVEQPDAGLVGVDADLKIVYQADPKFLGSTSFVYELCSITCPSSCDRALVSLEIGDINNCFAPTIITPNNDGINDFFHIPCLESGRYSNSELTVYNQWGDEVFQSSAYENSWAGTYNGDDLPTGTYYYIFKPSSTADIVKGFLIIER